MKKLLFTLTLAVALCLAFSAAALAADITNVKKVGDTATFGSFYGKPIEWQALAVDTNAGKALLIPTELIGFWAFNAQNDAVTWENSTIRKWLNGDFLSNVFTETQRAAILETEIDNKAHPATGSGGGTNTKDKVFLLSYDEAAKYFTSDSARAIEYNATDAQVSGLAKVISDKCVSEDWYYKITYDEANSELKDYVGYTDWWWLRTTGPESGRVACVNYDGSLDRHNEIYEPFGGLRPAIWVSLAAPAAPTASTWATAELAKAEQLGLIPDSLKGQDLTKPITRAEFAGVAVKVYEKLSGSAAIPAIENPFTDTGDIDVLKAYNTNLMVGTAADKFGPNVLLNRETAATALTRVFKRVTIPGWTLAADARHPLTYVKPAAFADDAKISVWAKDSVYFMAVNNIIGGQGGNMFAPRATTSDEEARGYAQATREVALVIAVRMVENLDTKTVSRATATAPIAPVTTQQSSAKSGAVSQILAGETRNIRFGQYDWRVLEVSGDKALLITEDIVKQEQEYQDLMAAAANWKDETTHFKWAYSLVRAYCNGEFLNTFTAEEQAMIIPTELVMEPNPLTDETSGPSTTDKVWCLSISETEKYFTFDEAFARNHTNRATEEWWLRTAGGTFNLASVAPHILDSFMGKQQETRYYGTNGPNGVRPAMWISLK